MVISGGQVGTLEFERLLADLSARFVGLPAETADEEIMGALAKIGTFLRLDRVILQEFTEDGRAAVVRHSWARHGVEAIPVGWLMGSQLPGVFEKMRKWEIVRIPDTATLDSSWATDKKEFQRSGARAHLSIPFAVGGGSVAFCLTLVSVRHTMDWSQSQVVRLRLLGEVFANALNRRDTEQRLRSALVKVRELQAELEAENLYLRGEIKADHNWEGLVGKSAALKSVMHTVERVAPTGATVLIQGETGTGKELIARALHAQSPRSKRPMVKVNCAALPDSLAESELFGHEKGAFTSADSRMMGRFELADKGTIFLDEIGELSLDVQAKLLRVLEEGEFERLGSSESKWVNVRVLAATSRDLERAVESGRFMSALFYRLNVIPIQIAPLRERREDIPLLAWHFVKKSEVRHAKKINTIPSGALDAMTGYGWPGNVRELENLIERAVILSPGDELVLGADLPVTLPSRRSREAVSGADLASVERSHIADVLKQCGWKVKGKGNAAEKLGLNPSTLRTRMRKLGITRPDRGKPA